MDKILILNRSTVLTDDQIKAVIPALQTQVHRDFAPVWGIDAEVEFADHHGGAWFLEVLDHTDVEGAGGYHTDANGRVSGKVFAADAMEAGEAWTVDLSHELLEMLADPTAGTDPSQYVKIPTGRYAGWHCLREVCDAVEGEQLAYEVADVKVSDFVTPAYFYQTNPTPMPQDQYALKSPLHEAAPGLLLDGYLGLQRPNGRWTQVADFSLMHRGRRSMHRAMWGLGNKVP